MSRLCSPTILIATLVVWNLELVCASGIAVTTPVVEAGFCNILFLRSDQEEIRSTQTTVFSKLWNVLVENMLTIALA